ncbi:MAG TPA: pitrilysin family protein [Candidatus Methylomirabilis sp.]|nr:pitrilysin family protein [Candidatus Methylomirabilis sp.]
MKPTLKKLTNGIPVILVPQKGAQSMTLFVFCRVGSRYESKDINGASHFIEHLMFKGTKRRPDTQTISKTLDQYGAEYNAMTSKDFTGYYVKMDAKQTPLAVDLLHDMLFSSLYDPKEIERERGVIVEEINMYEDNPRMHIEDLLEEALFPNSTLGWNIAGPREIIRSVPREKLIAYRDAYYVPSRLTLAVAGKLAPNVVRLLERTFGRVKEPKLPRDRAFEVFLPPKRLSKPLAFQNKKTEQVQLGMAFHGLPLGHADLPAASLLATILGGTMSSRLFIQVRERRGLCYSIHASHQALEDTGIFAIMAGLDKKRVREAVKTITEELKKAVRSGVTADELRRAKDHIRGKLTLAFEDSSFQADWYGKQWMFRKELETPLDRMRKLQRVSVADVRRVARAILRPAAMASAVIGPFESKQPLAKMFDWQ